MIEICCQSIFLRCPNQTCVPPSNQADPSISLQQQAANKKRMRTVKRIQNSATIIRW